MHLVAVSFLLEVGLSCVSGAQQVAEGDVLIFGTLEFVGTLIKNGFLLRVFASCTECGCLLRAELSVFRLLGVSFVCVFLIGRGVVAVIVVVICAAGE